MSNLINSRATTALIDNNHEQEEEAHYSFELQFERHKKAIKMNNMEEALQTFVLLQANSPDNEIFEAYIIEFSDHIDPSRNTNMSIFFATLPALIQSTIIEKIADTLEQTDTLRAFQTLFNYILNYSRHAYKYMIRAIKLLVLGAQHLNQNESQKYISLLVTELFPRLCKQRLLLTDKNTQPTVRSTDGKQYILLPYPLFEQYLLLGQQYYIEHREWQELNYFTDIMLDACGYTKLSQTRFPNHLYRFAYLQEKRTSLHIDDTSSMPALNVMIAFMCEFKAVAAEFVQFSYDYYRAVCTLDNNAVSSGDEKSCLIPVCAIKPLDLASNDEEDEEDEINSNNKRMNNDNHHQFTEYENNKRQKLVEYPDRGGEGLNAYCMGGVDNALQILSKAADCMRHIVELWEWASQLSPDTQWDKLYHGWEEEFVRVIELYQLPFDLTNAVLLVRSDLALSSPNSSGSLAKALKLSQSICDRIENHRRKYKKDNDTVLPSEFDIPFMFAFRVLYNIGVIYLLVGSIPQSTLEVAIILSVLPIPNDLDESDFLADEADCRTVAAVFHEHEFGLMRVTQEGLVVRCIKHLIVSLDNPANKSGMASLDSALRWDEKAGQMIVLMQYGWHYWTSRTNFWHKIIHRMKEKKAFRNRIFLEYVYVPEILQTLQHLHQYDQVSLDIIPPEFALRSGYRFFTQPLPRGIEITEENPSPQPITLPSLSSLTALPPPAPSYQPRYSNSILPSMTMSPTWYSASTQKNSHVDWMSPSFYYSRPATSVMLPKNNSNTDENDDATVDSSTTTQTISPDIVHRCLEYRLRKYTPQMTPQRMRHVLQRFLKNMLSKANEQPSL